MRIFKRRLHGRTDYVVRDERRFLASFANYWQARCYCWLVAE